MPIILRRRPREEAVTPLPGGGREGGREGGRDDLKDE